MSCTNSTTFYWPGASFASASQLFTDSNLTTIAPDGYYQQGGVWREISGGILGAASACPTCVIGCNTTVEGSGGIGEYTSDVNIGSTTGAVLIIFDNYSIPDKCTWTYDGVSASEYSTSIYGYMQGMIGEGADIGGVPCGGIPANCAYSCGGNSLSNASGSSGTQFAGTIFNGVTANGVTTWINSGVSTNLGPYANEAAGGTTLVPGQPGPAMMVVPKPNSLPDTLSIQIDGPCSGTAWQVQINCPIQLNLFPCEPSPANCSADLNDDFCTAHVGNSTGIRTGVEVNDWAFEDVNGVTQKPAGDYLVGFWGDKYCVTVSSDGIVTSVSLCSGSC
tara:strand:+ start:5537 stop:6538 length:1002 start_codon:yes stop_codon:yes gene_type:complete